jgi:hypothetical protein
MEKNYVRNYLVANGKYFPSRRLGTLGGILENSRVSEHVINKRFFNPIFITILFWIFWPFQLFDRLLLKDWFWGWMKLLLPLGVGFILYYHIRNPFVITSKLLGGNDIISIIGVGVILIWGVWTIIDGFTIYGRTKKANYRAVLRTLKINDDSYVVRTPTDTKTASKMGVGNSRLEEWRKANPNLTIKDYLNSK